MVSWVLFVLLIATFGKGQITDDNDLEIESGAQSPGYEVHDQVAEEEIHEINQVQLTAALSLMNDTLVNELSHQATTERDSEESTSDENLGDSTSVTVESDSIMTGHDFDSIGGQEKIAKQLSQQERDNLYSNVSVVVINNSYSGFNSSSSSSEDQENKETSNVRNSTDESPVEYLVDFSTNKDLYRKGESYKTLPDFERDFLNNPKNQMEYNKAESLKQSATGDSFDLELADEDGPSNEEGSTDGPLSVLSPTNIKYTGRSPLIAITEHSVDSTYLSKVQSSRYINEGRIEKKLTSVPEDGDTSEESGNRNSKIIHVTKIAPLTFQGKAYPRPFSEDRPGTIFIPSKIYFLGQNTNPKASKLKAKQRSLDSNTVNVSTSTIDDLQHSAQGNVLYQLPIASGISATRQDLSDHEDSIHFSPEEVSVVPFVPMYPGIFPIRLSPPVHHQPVLHHIEHALNNPLPFDETDGLIEEGAFMYRYSPSVIQNPNEYTRMPFRPSLPILSESNVLPVY